MAFNYFISVKSYKTEQKYLICAKFAYLLLMNIQAGGYIVYSGIGPRSTSINAKKSYFFILTVLSSAVSPHSSAILKQICTCTLISVLIDGS